MGKKIFLGTLLIILLIIGLSTGWYLYSDYKETLARETREAIYKENLILAHAEKVYGGQYYENTNLSGLTREEVTALITEDMNTVSSRTLEILLDKKAYSYPVSDLGVTWFFTDSNGNTYENVESVVEMLVSKGKNTATDVQYTYAVGTDYPEECRVSLSLRYKEKKVNKLCNRLYKLCYKKAQNATMDKNRKIVKGCKGRELDKEQIAADLKAFLETPSRENFSGEYKSRKIEPEWKVEDLKKVKTVLGEYTTTFAAGGNRGHNIKVGTSRVNGIFLLPGEKVSIDKVLHDGSDGQGYLAAPSYVSGRTVDTPGGGICQIASTLYNAILISGIQPTERHNHMMAVGYVPLGLDATISEGTLDLKIKNKLKYPIYIEGKTVGGSLTFKVYSYKKAKGGYTYKPRSQAITSLSANAYLDVYDKKGNLVKSIFMHRDSYSPHR